LDIVAVIPSVPFFVEFVHGARLEDVLIEDVPPRPAFCFGGLSFPFGSGSSDGPFYPGLVPDAHPRAECFGRRERVPQGALLSLVLRVEEVSHLLGCFYLLM
jgi:hypothetical protein